MHTWKLWLWLMRASKVGSTVSRWQIAELQYESCVQTNNPLDRDFCVFYNQISQTLSRKKRSRQQFSSINSLCRLVSVSGDHCRHITRMALHGVCRVVYQRMQWLRYDTHRWPTGSMNRTGFTDEFSSLCVCDFFLLPNYRLITPKLPSTMNRWAISRSCHCVHRSVDRPLRWQQKTSSMNHSIISKPMFSFGPTKSRCVALRLTFQLHTACLC